MTHLLLGSDATPGNGDDGLLTGYGLPNANMIPYEGIAMEGGTYYVTLIDDPADLDGDPLTDSNSRILARCRGVTDTEGSASIDVVIGHLQAVEFFTLAIDRASLSSAGEAPDIVNMARVGRARAKLNLGDGPGAITDAEAVDMGFIGLANYETTPTRLRWDRPVSMDDNVTLQAAYRNLLVGGVPDPRVPTEHTSRNGGVTPQYTLDWWVQLKYNSRGSDIPISTWREAQLMIAEADPARSVAIINLLRSDPAGIHSELDSSAWPLPAYVDGGAVANAAQVIEERRRELFLQGTKIGDDLRTGEFQNWDTGVAASGLQIDPNVSCMPIPVQEFL